jgi:hypothetical protein
MKIAVEYMREERKKVECMQCVRCKRARLSILATVVCASQEPVTRYEIEINQRCAIGNVQIG